MEAGEDCSGQLCGPILTPWAIYGTCMASGKDHTYFYKLVMTRRSCTFSLWEGDLLHLSGKKGGKKDSPSNQLNLNLGHPVQDHGETGTEVRQSFLRHDSRGLFPDATWIMITSENKVDFIICFKFLLPNRLCDDSRVNSYL